MVKSGVAPSRPFVFLSHICCLLFFLYEAGFTGGGLLSVSVPTSVRSFMTSHINADHFSQRSLTPPPQGSAGRHWLAVSIPDHMGSATLGGLRFVLVSVSDSLRVEYVSLYSSYSAFPLFWGLSKKVWISKPFRRSFCLITPWLCGCWGILLIIFGNSLCFKQVKQVSFSQGLNIV